MKTMRMNKKKLFNKSKKTDFSVLLHFLNSPCDKVILQLFSWLGRWRGALKRWKTTDNSVLVSTTAAAQGLDCSIVRQVIVTFCTRQHLHPKSDAFSCRKRRHGRWMYTFRPPSKKPIKNRWQRTNLYQKRYENPLSINRQIYLKL